MQEALEMNHATEQDSDVVQYVCFKLANEEYAIEIAHVREVIRVPSITVVPQMPPFTMGIINIRGTVIPVFDIRLKLGLPQKEVDGKTKIIVAIENGQMISFLVDEIQENLKLDKSQIDPAPTVKMKIDSGCIKGIGKLDGRMIIILKLDKIHAGLKEDIGQLQK